MNLDGRADSRGELLRLATILRALLLHDVLFLHDSSPAGVSHDAELRWRTLTFGSSHPVRSFRATPRNLQRLSFSYTSVRAALARR